MVKTEIRENPVRYSQDNIQRLNEAVQKLESNSNNLLYETHKIWSITILLAMVKFSELAIEAAACAHNPHNIRMKDIEEAAQNVRHTAIPWHLWMVNNYCNT